MILADTTFLIDALRKKVDVQRFLQANKSIILLTTEINVFELYLGIFANKILAKNPELLEKRILEIENLISKFQILPFNRQAVIEAARIVGNLILDGQKIEFRDGMIAAIAISHGITQILTKNVQHFNRISKLTVVSY